MEDWDLEYAQTVAEANAQEMRLATCELNLASNVWLGYAYTLDGDLIATELGINLLDWGGEKVRKYRFAKEWQLSLLELRLLLYVFARLAENYFGETIDIFEIVHSILTEIHNRKGIIYKGGEETYQRILRDGRGWRKWA